MVSFKGQREAGFFMPFYGHVVGLDGLPGLSSDT